MTLENLIMSIAASFGVLFALSYPPIRGLFKEGWRGIIQANRDMRRSAEQRRKRK